MEKKLYLYKAFVKEVYDGDTITVDIDTTTWTPFDYSLINTSGTSPPLCIPVGSGSVDNGGVQEVIFEDAFDNRRV